VWAAACAERVLPLFTVHAPDDARPRAAIEGARKFARGAASIGSVRTLAAAAHTAARSVDDPAAVAAARAAGHAAAVAHMASHALGAPAYAARAVDLAAGASPGAAADEIAWAAKHASEEVRSVLRRLPRRSAQGAALAGLIHELDTRLSADA
jgi:hypothetical protein